MRVRQWLMAGFACSSLGASAVWAETDTVLVCYSANIMRFTVQDGAWTAQSDFAQKAKSYGGSSYNFAGIASDGRRVFMGEAGGVSSRILEFDLDGNYLRRLAFVGTNVEFMCASQNGRWIYATVGISLNTPTNSAVVHRYDPVTGAGGVFIPNVGTNEAGAVLWQLQALRGLTTDTNGLLWVSERYSGKIYVFNEATGAYSNTVTGLTNVQGLHYSAQDNTVYATSSSGDNTFAINATTFQKSTYTITGADNRFGITQVQGALCSARYTYGDISSYNLPALTRTTLIAVPASSRQLITLPRAPLRPALGKLLIAETVSNRVAKVSVDTGYALDTAGPFAGGAGAVYDGAPLRSPRGLVAFSNWVYVAEGVAGGRVLRFNKWGTYKGVAIDFSATSYTSCVPTALALAPDGQTLYVSDARLLYVAGNNGAWMNVPTNGYFLANSYGETIYKVALASKLVSVFASSASLTGGSVLLEPRGLAVDANTNVYCSTWYSKANAITNDSGVVYRFDAAGVKQASFTAQNPSVCYFDPASAYAPAATNALIVGAGILCTGNGIEDFWWTAAGGAMATRSKMLDLSYWRDYLDVEVVDGRMWYTDPEYGMLWRRNGEATAETVLSGLATPTYLTFTPETGAEPPPTGTLMTLN